ncbi:DNA-nicking Smr family endonuclease [Rhodopseudomonas rhenobacensis]|uniref:DNA-nicking Smr family endonuclease n=1 Tax=Rhodopseudomonas rhenobacensis TaxID=87461 RepID=A0A7W7Z634_9BRAD|nr:Smr/MutS family protein [Rhodopseudomonas rhenobacensis]MBB5048480.1 DNA-nicking Smr family endonuclease [Rhodopseudomonas rhenobacensis]
MSKKPPQLSDPVVPSRRRRALSEPERELWESVAKQVKPLRKKHRVAKPTATAAAAPESAVGALKSAVKLAAVKPIAPLKIKPPPKLDAPRPAPPLAPIGRRERAHLSRGKKSIDGRIDLHGMTQTRAHGALLSFLHRASLEGMTFVLVITGKGRTVGPESERGILRRQVPHWLGLPEFRTLVVGFEEAHIGHGGEGALYVRVRRVR